MNQTLHLAESRRVDIASVAAPRAPVTGAEEAPSHPDVLSRILDTLRATSTGTGAPITSLLSTLQKEVQQRLHTEKKSQLAVPLPGTYSPVSNVLRSTSKQRHKCSKSGRTQCATCVASIFWCFRSTRSVLYSPPIISLHARLQTSRHRRIMRVKLKSLFLKAGVGDDGHIQRSDENWKCPCCREDYEGRCRAATA